ncbi:ATP-grasp domain-containing protein [Sorangium sp. So ce204]|uniref:ATP-grasp domain-containing protein n=1 Tax=Sorangium sp. So ce204 TaxID=3133288 RepID=UPI003F62C920
MCRHRRSRRPNDDLKRFTGQVLRFSECVALFQTLRGAARPVEPTSEVVLGEPREIDGEWRLFVVDGEVVTGSMYRPSGDSHLPRELIDFAERAASRWAPASVFVLDVARVDGAWKIVECNCFNGSRFLLGRRGARRTNRLRASGAGNLDHADLCPIRRWCRRARRARGAAQGRWTGAGDQVKPWRGRLCWMMPDGTTETPRPVPTSSLGGPFALRRRRPKQRSACARSSRSPMPRRRVMGPPRRRVMGPGGDAVIGLDHARDREACRGPRSRARSDRRRLSFRRVMGPPRRPGRSRAGSATLRSWQVHPAPGETRAPVDEGGRGTPIGARGQRRGPGLDVLAGAAAVIAACCVGGWVACCARAPARPWRSRRASA